MTRWPPALALLVSLLIVTADPLSSAASLESTTNGADVQSVSAPTAESILRKAPQGIESEPTSTRTAGPKTTETITNASGNQASPWGTEELIVAIDRTTTNQSNVSRLVADALEYWNTAGNEYATYPVKFTLRPAAANPDIVVRFKPDIDCTRARWELGCAPIIEPGSSIDHPALVRIDAEYTKATTRRVLKHEFGHIVGIRHGEAPTELMRPQYAATTRRQLPNASERANPWGRSTLTVYVAQDRLPPWKTKRYYDQIRHALAYYQDGAEGTVPESISFRFVDRRSRANIVIGYWPQGTCEGVMVGSCATSAGIDLDGDDRREYLTQIRIALAGIKPKAVGWHVGYWTGLSLEPAGRSALAPPFRTADPADRTSRWWVDEGASDTDRTADPASSADTPESRFEQSIEASREVTIDNRPE